RGLSSAPSSTPVTGSCCFESANGKEVAANRPRAVGVAQRLLRSSLDAPAMLAMTASNTCRFFSSVLKPRYRKLGRNRPLCELPNAYAYLDGGGASVE